MYPCTEVHASRAATCPTFLKTSALRVAHPLPSGVAAAADRRHRGVCHCWAVGGRAHRSWSAGGDCAQGSAGAGRGRGRLWGVRGSMRWRLSRAAQAGRVVADVIEGWAHVEHAQAGECVLVAWLCASWEEGGAGQGGQGGHCRLPCTAARLDRARSLPPCACPPPCLQCIAFLGPAACLFAACFIEGGSLSVGEQPALQLWWTCCCRFLRQLVVPALLLRRRRLLLLSSIQPAPGPSLAAPTRHADLPL